MATEYAVYDLNPYSKMKQSRKEAVFEQDTRLNKFEIPISQCSITIVIKLKRCNSKQNMLDVNTRTLRLPCLSQKCNISMTIKSQSAGRLEHWKQ